METYKLRSGETAWGVARKFGVPLHLLLEVNRISDPSRMKPGQLLLIPGMTTDTSDHPVPRPEPPPPAEAGGAPAIDRERFRLPPSQYVQEETPKDLVMLHFTAGSNAQGAYQSWIGTDARVATAYILDRDGTVYELFDPSFWAFHLGIKGAASANFKHDKRSIGIEIVNVGPLKERDGKLCWWPNDFGAPWCSPAEADKFVRASYRGFTHFAAFTEAQYQSLKPLVAHLCGRFQIPAHIPAVSRRGVEDAAGFFKTWTGIASHQNYRADKTDVGPAFDWARVSL